MHTHRALNVGFNQHWSVSFAICIHDSILAASSLAADKSLTTSTPVCSYCQHIRDNYHLRQRRCVRQPPTPTLQCRIDELETHVTNGATSEAANHAVSKSPDQNIPGGDGNIEALAARLKEVEARERAIKEQQARDAADKGKEGKQQEALRLKVSHVTCHNWLVKQVLRQVVVLSRRMGDHSLLCQCLNGKIE